MRKAVGQTKTEPRLKQAELEHARALERQEIARDLHDTVIQPLTALITRFELLRYETLSPGMVQAYMGGWEELAREALNALRATLSGLRSPHPHAEFGLPEALRRFKAFDTRSAGIRLTIESRNWPDTVPLPLMSNLYLLVREALTNVEKHARASEATVLLTRDAHNLRIIIADDGVGLREGDRQATVARQPGSGLGIYGMRERVRALGGRLSLSSSPGNGVRVEINVPCPREEQRTALPPAELRLMESVMEVSKVSEVPESAY